MNAPNRVTDRELTITRLIDVPARYLFRAFTTAEHIRRWFGPRQYPVTFCESDFRVGGRFRCAMTGPDNKLGPPFGGTWREIVPDSRIVYEIGFEDPGSEPMIVTVTFEERDGRTLLTHHTLFASAAQREEYIGMGIEAGLDSALEQLAELAALLAARP